jgi:hypothetical protein
MPRRPNHTFTSEERARGSRARAEKLRDRKDEARRIAEDVLREEVRPRAERIAETIQIAEAVRVKYAAQLFDEDYQLRGTDLAALLRIEALLEGEATERVSVAEVEAFMDALRDDLLALVGEERADELAEALLRAAAVVRGRAG